MLTWASACIANGVLYAAVVAVAALAAIFAPTTARRRAAREVLQILLFRSPTRNAPQSEPGRQRHRVR